MQERIASLNWALIAESLQEKGYAIVANVLTNNVCHELKTTIVTTAYKGGEFVLTQQIPRAQSKAIVLKPQKGNMMIFTTYIKPKKGTEEHYMVNMKHGVSPLHSGQRHTLGIIFHDAQT